MKKLLALLLALVMTLCLMTACNNEDDTETTGTVDSTETTGDADASGSLVADGDETTEPSEIETVASGSDLEEESLPASDGTLETFDYSTMPASDGDLEDGE